MKLREPEIRAFLEHLQEMPGIEDWQVQQALDAIVLYFERFCGIELGEIELVYTGTLIERSTTHVCIKAEFRAKTRDLLHGGLWMRSMCRIHGPITR